MKVKCEECHGYGGLRYEPGLLTYICNKCQGKGEIDKPDPPKAKEYLVEVGVIRQMVERGHERTLEALMEEQFGDLDGRTFQVHVKPDKSLLLVEVTMDPSLRRCPACVKGERCGREAGHEGKHMWGRGD